MKRWDAIQNKKVEVKAIDEFLAEVVQVCQKHGFSITHEGRFGCFEVVPYEDFYVRGLMNAHIAEG